MDLKYFILILFCGHLNDTFFSETEAITTEKQPRSSVSENPQNSSENFSDQPTSGQPTLPTKVTAIYVSSGKPTAHTSSEQKLAHNITRQPVTMTNTSFQRTALPVFTSARQLLPSGHISTRQQPQSVYTSPQQSSSVHTSSRKPVSSTVYTISTQATSTVKTSTRSTPGFIVESITNKKDPHKINSNSTAAILIGVILTSMLVAIIIIVLWKCFKKPVSNDQNWAGRSPFADGETPDLCLDNIRENEVSTKRTSIVSLMAWKPSKGTLIGDDLEIKLFESSENIEDSNPQAEKIKDQVNGTSEESAGGSTIGTAVSSSDDADLPAPPLSLLGLEGQESNQSDKPTMTITVPFTNDATNLPPSLDSLTQVSEDHNVEFEQVLPPPPDSFSLPLPPTDFTENQEDSNNKTQCQELSIIPGLDQDLNEPLPLPPEELL